MPGYEAKFVHPLLKRYECPICLFAMRNPVQTECGHLFCRECLEPVLKRRPILCPIEKEEISQIRIFPDNACQREILQLDVYCTSVVSGCTWIGPLKDLESHTASCMVQCMQFGQYIQVLELTKHKEMDCPMRPELCPHCGKEVPSQQMQAHIDKMCLEVPHLCPNYNGCDSPKMKQLELERHLAIKDGQCPHSEVDCPFKPNGSSSATIRKNSQTHLEQYSASDYQMPADCFVELERQAEKNSASDAIQHLMERVRILEIRLNAIERLLNALKRKVQLLDDQNAERNSDRDQIANAIILCQGTEYTMHTELCQYCGKEVPSQQMQAHINRVCSEVLNLCSHRFDSPQQPEMSYLEDSQKTAAFNAQPLPAYLESDGMEDNYTMNTSIQKAIGNGNSSLVPGQLCIPHGILMGDLPSPLNELGVIDNDNRHSEMNAEIPVETSINRAQLASNAITVTNLVNTDNMNVHTSMEQEAGGGGDDARPRLCGT